MRRSRNILTLLRIQFEWANKKKQIFGRYQSYKRRNLKKPRSSGDENARCQATSCIERARC